MMVIAVCALAMGALAADLGRRAGWRLEQPGERAARHILIGEDQAEADLAAEDKPADGTRGE